MRGRLVKAEPGLGYDGAEDVAYGFLMCASDRHDAFGIAMLGYRKSKCTAPELRAVGLFIQALENNSDLVSRSTRRVQGLPQGANNTFVAILEIGCNKMIFGREVSIERCLCNFRFFDNAIYPNSPNTFAVK